MSRSRPPLDMLVPAAYPMVEETDATGRVAAVYGSILELFPMVPSLFKSLAVHPPYLVLAWAQVGTVLATEDLRDRACQLVDRAEGVVSPPEPEAVREVLGDFVGPLARMLLVTAGLRLALDGQLQAPAAQLEAPAAHGQPVPELDVPSPGEVDAALAGAIRRDLATPIVNSVWRVAAAAGVLDQAWEHLAPRTRTVEFRQQCHELDAAATGLAHGLNWETAASPAALDRAGSADALPGIRALLKGYLRTLPRVLAVVASTRRPDST